MKLFTVILWLILGIFYYFFWDYQYMQCCDKSSPTQESVILVEQENLTEETSSAEVKLDSIEEEGQQNPAESNEEEAIEKLVLYFTYNSSELIIPEIYKKEVEKLIDYARENQQISLEITGHTDNLGSNEANHIVGLTRAENMRSYLKDKGVENSITCLSQGEEQPIADNSTQEGRAKNRRIELTIKK